MFIRLTYNLFSLSYPSSPLSHFQFAIPMVPLSPYLLSLFFHRQHHHVNLKKLFVIRRKKQLNQLKLNDQNSSVCLECLGNYTAEEMQEALIFLAIILAIFIAVCSCQMYHRAKWELEGNKGKRPMPMAPYDRDVFVVWWCGETEWRSIMMKTLAVTPHCCCLCCCLCMPWWGITQETL